VFLKKLGVLLLCLFVPLFVGGLAGGLTAGSGMYEGLEKPAFSPPGWIFPLVWTVLYALMGLSCYLTLMSPYPKGKLWRGLYIATLALNFVWPFLFFTFRAFLFSFLWILVMWAVGFVLTREFFTRSKWAGVLFLPYMVWITFAAYLNYGIAMLN